MHLRHAISILSLLILSLPTVSQTPVTSLPRAPIPYGFSYEQWEAMNKRWQPYSSWINAIYLDGTTIEGQLIKMSDSYILLQTNKLLPDGSFNTPQHLEIRLADLAKMQLRESGHPYKGLIIGLLAGAAPGAVTGLILAQGWTYIPALIFGTITGAVGGFTGSRIQRSARREEIDIVNGMLSDKSRALLEKSSLFQQELPPGFPSTSNMNRETFEQMIPYSPSLDKAFPEKKWSLSVNTSLITNNLRKKIFIWHMAPLWGPPDGYYETRIGLEANLTRKVGPHFEVGALIHTVPGDVAYTYLDRHSEELGLDYQYNRSFHQNTFGIFGGWRIEPSGRFYNQRFRGSVQTGFLLSDVFEHFYNQWNNFDDYEINTGHLTRKHYWRPGLLLKVKADYYLIPGFSIFIAGEGFWLRAIEFEQRTLLPETRKGPFEMTYHRLNFSNFQLCAGFSVHL